MDQSWDLAKHEQPAHFQTMQQHGALEEDVCPMRTGWMVANHCGALVEVGAVPNAPPNDDLDVSVQYYSTVDHHELGENVPHDYAQMRGHLQHERTGAVEFVEDLGLLVPQLPLVPDVSRCLFVVLIQALEEMLHCSDQIPWRVWT